VKKSVQNFQVSELQIPQRNIMNLKIRQDNCQRNFVLQKIHSFFMKIDALNIEYISRKW
jgi:outer membrane lipoprotein SlyB